MEKYKLSESGWGSIQSMPTEDLLMLINGEVDVLRIFREEISSRGLDKKGKWVGFEESSLIWQEPN